jgi:CubicO group peptidase (beta-lactamase class C family)
MRQWRNEKLSRRLAVAALLLLLLLLASAVGGARAEQPRQFSADGLAKVSDYIRNEVATGKIPGAILLIQQHGKPVYQENFGVRDITTELSMSADTIFRLYSMSKPITSVAAMMLVEDGKVAIGDPVSKYIPAFADVKVGVAKRGDDGKATLTLEPLKRPITIEDLLRHTSGITYGFYGNDIVHELYAAADLFNGDFSNAEFVERLARLPLQEQPGTKWDYGHSTDVLGRVIEVVSGQSLYQFEKQRLLDPLGMSETAFYVADGSKRPRVAEPMPSDSAISPTTRFRDIMQARKSEGGGAGLVGTVGDYARFCQMLLSVGTYEGRTYLKPATIELMASDHIGPETKIARDGAYYPGDTSGFGLGFAVRTSVPANTEWPLGEYRWDGVGGTFFFIDPVDDMFVVFMVQTPSERGRIQLELKTLIYKAMGR